MAGRRLTGKLIRPQLPEPDAWLVPTIVQLELQKWLIPEADESRADRVLAFSMTCQIAPLDTKIALRAADLCATYKLATADAIVYATALEHGADVLTCDAHFERLDRVVFIAKR